MKTKQKNFYQIMNSYMRAVVCMVVIALFCAPSDAAVVARGQKTAARAPTVTASKNTTTKKATTTTEKKETTSKKSEPAVTDDDAEEDEKIIIEDKSDQFSTTLSKSSKSGATDASRDDLSEMIRRQRAALDAADATASADSALKASLSSNQNVCDAYLRQCMAEKCGKDFTKCSGDGDTIWGDKMDACRAKTTCTGEEYRLFTTEIKADRDLNAQLASYNEIIDCGNDYNECIIAECGKTYSKCLGKKAGDQAISKCSTIANECKQMDSGLANRTMNVFGTLRQDAEVQVKADEKRLYELRDKMAEQCRILGAMFDERSLDCVYTVEFYANNSSTPYASKKAYAGSSFDCNQNWFGLDITTFKENAYRYTRSQTAATSALMGSGVGIAVGAVTSGAIDRAIETKKAKNALKKAEKEAKKGDKKDAKKDKEADKEDNDKDTNKDKDKGKEDSPKEEKKSDTSKNDGPKDLSTDSLQAAADEKHEKDMTALNELSQEEQAKTEIPQKTTYVKTQNTGPTLQDQMANGTLQLKTVNIPKSK